jgi:hypothetical protein
MRDWKDILYDKYKDEPLPSIFIVEEDEKNKSENNSQKTCGY